MLLHAIAVFAHSEYQEGMGKILTALASISLIALLVAILFRRKQEEGTKGAGAPAAAGNIFPSRGKKRRRPGDGPQLSGKHCPLCGSALYQGQSVKSVLYPKSPGAPDRLMEIHGCPNCYPHPGKEKRICPVCKQEVPPEGDVIARVFDKEPRRHVHVLGCSSCYRRKRG